MVVDVIGTERLLDPVRIKLLVHIHVALRGHHIRPGVVGVEHEQGLVANRGTRGSDACFFLFRAQPTYLHFHRLEPGIDVTGQLVAQHRRRLAFEIVTATGIGRDRTGCVGP